MRRPSIRPFFRALPVTTPAAVLAAALLGTLVISGCGSNTGSTADGAATVEGEMFPLDGDYAGSHILIAFEGASRANPEITRTKEEALEKARGLIERLKSDPDQFETLAMEESDGPSGPQGGSLGAWRRGAMVPEFDAAIEQLEVGAVTEEPVETAFGYHVIRRNSLEAPHFGIETFILAYAGGPQTPPGVERSFDDALALADSIKQRLNPDNYDELADEYNDFADGSIFLGGFAEAAQVPIPGALEAVKPLEIGAVAGPIEFPAGFAFVRRAKLDQRSGAHILIAYEGAMRAAPGVTRTKDEALAEATALAAELSGTPDQFTTMAMSKSDGPSAQTGGDLGVWFRGQMVPEFDVALDSLAVDQITATPVETPFGYHIIQRRAIPE